MARGGCGRPWPAWATTSWTGPRWTNWGERWPAWRILWTMIDHDAHHGAEIGCLRDLYRATAGGG
jgi:hypothetical protein